MRQVWRLGRRGAVRESRQIAGARRPELDAVAEAGRKTIALPAILSPMQVPGQHLPKPTPANLRRFAETPIVRRAIVDSFVKLNPATLMKNPVMFVVVVGAALTTFLMLRTTSPGMAAGLVFCAGIAMQVWVNAEPGLARAAAFNCLLIAGVSTLLFNGNPLLRFDAYFILSDLIEIPNLGTRATRYYGYLVNRYAFGLWIFVDLTIIALGAGAFFTGFLSVVRQPLRFHFGSHNVMPLRR